MAANHHRCPSGHTYNFEDYVVCPICGFPDRFRKLGMLQPIGKGSVGAVYKLLSLEMQYALKVIPCAGNTVQHHNGLYEIRIMQQLETVPQAVHMLGWEEYNQNLFILEECLEPFTAYSSKTLLSRKDILRLLTELCEGLASFRSHGVFHLDIQPKNLFLTRDGHLKIGDFSSSLLAKDLSASRSKRGTPQYMAPEVYHGGSCSERSDIYSVGLLIYYLSHHYQLPLEDLFDSQKALQLRLSNVFPVCQDPDPFIAGLEQIYLQACEINPEQRIQTFEDLALLLKKLEPLASASHFSSVPAPPAAVCSPMVAARPAATMDETTVAQTWVSGEDETTWIQTAPIGNAAPSFAPADLLSCIPMASACPVSEPVEPGISGDDETTWIQTEPIGNTVPSFAPEPSFSMPPSPNISYSAPPGTVFDADELATSVMLSMPSSLMPESSACNPIPAPAPRPNVPPRSSTRETDVPSFYANELPRHSAPQAAANPPRKGLLSGLSSLFSSRKQKPTPADAASVTMSRVQFSALAPEILSRGKYAMIDLYMYEETFRKVVDQAIAKSKVSLQEKQSGSIMAAVGARIRIILTSPDLEIEDNELEQTWHGNYLNFSYAVSVPAHYAKDQILFSAAVYIDDILSTRLKFFAACDGSPRQRMDVLRNDILSAFVSYASEDRNRVATIIQGMKKARPDLDIFFDVESLRSGEDWETALYREIEARDLLYLCWSQSASRSKWVDAEWRYAMDHKGLSCIEPIPIDPPKLCPPPVELQGKHFNDKLLYIINDHG